MNFLEELAAEWYRYKGFLTVTNLRFGPRAKGGYEGEIDVLAWEAKKQRLIHIECSTDADRWDERVQRFQKKFTSASEHYNELLGMDFNSVEQIAIVGFSSTKVDFGNGIVHTTVPEFINMVREVVARINPMTGAISETMPLLRAIQYSAWYAVDSHLTRTPPSSRPPCLCGCGGYPKGKTSRFLPGHDRHPHMSGT